MIKGVAKEVLEELKKFSVGSNQWIAVLKSNSKSNLAEKKLDGLLAALVQAGYSLEVLEGILSSIVLGQDYIDQLDALPFTSEQIAEVVAVLSGVTGNIEGTESSFTADSFASSPTVESLTGAAHLVGGALDLGSKTITVNVTSGSIDGFEGALINKTAGAQLTTTGVSITTGSVSSGVVNNGTVRTGSSSLTSFVLSREADGVYIDGVKLLDNSELPAETIQIAMKWVSSEPFSINVTVS